MKVCVFCSCSPIGQPYAAQTYALGNALGTAGHELVFGGFDEGLMGEIARGFAEAGAAVTGVVPATLVNKGRHVFKGCTTVYETRALADRKDLMVDISDAFVVAPGGIGTLDELFSVLAMVIAGERSCPVVVLNTEGFFDGVYDCLVKMAEDGFIRRPIEEVLFMARTPQEVAACLQEKGE